MYSQGETFYFDIDDEEFELHVLQEISVGERDYLLAEDFNGRKHVFLYDEEEDEVHLVDDRNEALEIIDYWKNEYLGDEDIGDWDDDEYYDREDDYNSDDLYDNYDYDDDDDGDYY